MSIRNSESNDEREGGARFDPFTIRPLTGYVSFVLAYLNWIDERFVGRVSGSREHYFCFRSAGQFWTRVSDCVLPSLGVTATNR
jgi:hypothetical protein